MVLQTHNIHLELPSASAAVRYTLDGFPMSGGLSECARLLASELVTNAVRHSAPDPTLRSP